MNKSIVLGAGIGCVVVGLGFGVHKLTSKPAFAQVVNVAPVTELVQMPVEECEDTVVTRVRPTDDPNRIGGTVVGGVLGGAIGNQLGSGRTRGLVTVAGAVAGGYAGNQLQKNMQKNDTYQATRRRCKMVLRPTEKVVGYDVKYLYDGELQTVRLERNPGTMLPVRDGQVITVGL